MLYVFLFLIGVARAYNAPASGTLLPQTVPTEQFTNDLTTVIVNRTAQRSVTSWQSFNISADTLLDFDRGVTGGSVLVRVVGQQGNASDIRGRTKFGRGGGPARNRPSTSSVSSPE